jgi:ribonucleoside-diphosphate reductase alpha chain
MLSMLGGGIGLGFGIRPRGEKSTGIFPHIKTYDADTIAWKQGSTRRGAIAAYLDVDHPEIQEFVSLRDPFGGDANRKSLNIHHGINLTDDFMHRVEQLSTRTDLTKEETEELDKFPLYHESSDKIEYASVKQLWQSIIETRIATGEPYCHFIDTSNNALPEHQKALGLKIKQSNLCAEITLPVGIDYNNLNRTAVCCLSSLNLAKWDEWKDHPTFVQDIVEMLDNVLEVFIQDGGKIPEISDAVYSAKQERSIGIGALGWHDLLQSKMISFESPMAIGLNKRIFKHIKDKAVEATNLLANMRGACKDETDYLQMLYEQSVDARGEFVYKEALTKKSVRNSNLMSIAPNASSSIILNTSPSIEPNRANVYREEGSSGVFMKRNKHLEALLESKDKNIPEVWSDIMAHDGSVQHIKFLEDYEKEVFKTAIEIDQKWVLQHAADRQEYICQSQSLNLFFAPTASIEYISYIHLLAWKMKIKTLYYFRSDTVSKASKLGKSLEREKIAQLRDLVSSDEDVCVACEG